MNWAQILQAFSRPFQWWVTVAAWEQAVLVRLGKRTHHLMPGVHFRIPFFDRVTRMCVRERVVEADSRTSSTKDGRPLTIGLSIRYAVGDASVMLKNVARPESTLRALAQARAAEYISSVGSEFLSPDIISSFVTDELQRPAIAWGLRDVQVFVVTFAYARAVRLLVMNDNGYSSSLDHELDRNPAVVN